MENIKDKNIVLIGMPTSGKSTVGVILAKVRGMDFIDTDIIMQQNEGAKLSEIIASRGIDEFLVAEERTLLGINMTGTVIATGGSAVYSKAAMDHLSSVSTVIYLKIEPDELKRRLKDLKERGVILKPGETIDEMFAVRSKLYEKYADITISEDSFSIEDTIQAIQSALS